jgi:hypothetical protein
MQSQLMGNSWLPFLCFAVSVVLVVWLLRELADVTIGEATRGALIRSMIAMTGVILLMTAARQLSRPIINSKAPPAAVSSHGRQTVGDPLR